MVACKFFFQGNCRFGENCKFEHQLDDNRQQHSQHASIIRQQNFTANTNNANIDINTLVRAVSNDMLAAEKGGQWLLSCYAPFKEKPNFPGFDEQSFEEIRWRYYEARISGNIEQYAQQLQMSLQAAAMKIRSLQNPSQDAIITIKNIYTTAPNNSAAFGNRSYNGASNPFGQSNTFTNTNVFGQNNQQQGSSAKSIFAAANQSLFSNTQQQPNSIFGNQMGVASGQSIFGNAPQNNTFAAATPFAHQNQNFGQPVVQQNTNAGFGMQQTFNMQPQPSTTPFVGVQPQSNSPLFTVQQNTSSPFGVKPPENLPYGGHNQQFGLPFATQANTNLQFNMPQQNAASPFSGQRQGNTPFGIQANAPTVAPFANPQSNIFPGMNASQATDFGNNANVNESPYSKLEDLSESDIKAYESDSFEFGKIPEKPPTRQMCF